MIEFPFDASCVGDSAKNPDVAVDDDDAASLIYIGDSLAPGKSVAITTLYNR